MHSKLYQHENRDAAEFDFKVIIDASVGTQSTNFYSQLVKKIDCCKDMNFSVSEYSLFMDDEWFLLKGENFTTKKIKFNHELEGSNSLKKVIAYYLIPEFNPFGTIKSYESTVTYSRGHSLVEMYVFNENNITASPHHIKLITAKMLNNALDAARDDGAGRHYGFLFFYIRFWLSLSDQKLIPDDFCLDVSNGKVDTKERRKDIVNEINANHQGWEPFTDLELTKLMDYAFFWLEKGIPVLLDARNYAISTGFHENEHSQYIKNVDDLEFERIFGTKVDDITVIGYSKSHVECKVNNRLYHSTHYYWRWKYAVALDKVRDGLFILVAMITGMRKKELGVLIFDDFYRDGNGSWYIKITRFKTSLDPNYFGDIDEISLPAYVGEQVLLYKELRDFCDYMRKGLLFQPVSSTHEVNLVERMIERLARNLRDEVGVDSLHAHRFRKTIAEILIHRSERNIDIIRLLFGHKSYSMTLKYISRNPWLLTSVVELMEESFAADFVDIVTAVNNGRYSGNIAENIVEKIRPRPEYFKGKMLKYTAFEYISYLLEAGEPIFIQRTMLGAYCLSNCAEFNDFMPPCLAGKAVGVSTGIPDTSNCQLECRNIVITEAAADSLERNIKFYADIIQNSSNKLSKAVRQELDDKIKINRKHLNDLYKNRGINKTVGYESIK